MDSYKKIYEELQTRYTDEEIAEGFMIPAQSLAEVSEADSAEFLEQRLKLLEERTEEYRALAEAIRLRIQVQSYLEEEPFSEEYSFASVLAAYLALSGREEAVFAAQLDIRLVQRVMNERKRAKFYAERVKKRRRCLSIGVPLFDSKSGIDEVQYEICRLQPFDDPAEQVYCSFAVEATAERGCLAKY